MSTKPSQDANRRQFLQTSGALAAGAVAASAALSITQSAYAAGNDQLKVGLIGCGGRGTGAASQALRADKNVKLHAVGDAFEDRLETSLKKLGQLEDVAPKLDVPPERRFVGFDAYQQVIDSGVDVVLLATPPHFRPMHIEAAIAAGKHIFAEKPTAVDAEGVRRVLKSVQDAKAKNLSLVAGLCLRNSYGFREAIDRVHQGEAGDIHTLHANDYRGTIWLRPRQPDWTDMHWQMRNWYYFTWLSGDFNVEQHVHFLDMCAWTMGDQYPVSAIGMGGREVRKGPEFGNIFDHHSVVYEYANGAKLISNTRQMQGCKNELGASAVGSKARVDFKERKGGTTITWPDRKWVYEGEDNNIYQTEHDEMFAGIRNGTPVNNGEYLAKSTMLAIMGRMATYTGQLVTWDQAMNSQEVLAPKSYAWGEAPEVNIAVPGITKLV
ncbi:Gfo/Idh/MocA family protein [Lignipirellula cremea]|uniref:Inositol 2-dehydrogenase n=1 Tax=Lignipirellula cremea TaxID=2528010 RepID=A0A518E016_9BACT|nr:Gfo/Idh/MocA family oxidoreductase [Lignipirellula cremea]QDU97432.1 Inositol 2-dehydrogenase [Lignipirellula cremea]